MGTITIIDMTATIMAMAMVTSSHARILLVLAKKLQCL
jgi:hypothetical protein